MSAFEQIINPCILVSVIFSNASFFVYFLNVSILSLSDASENFSVISIFLSFLLVLVS